MIVVVIGSDGGGGGGGGILKSNLSNKLQVCLYKYGNYSFVFILFKNFIV